MNKIMLMIAGVLLCYTAGCSKPPSEGVTHKSSADPSSTAQKRESLPLQMAKQELTLQKQSLHDRLDYRVVEKDWGWIVTVGNLSGKQPKGQAYLPGDAVMIRIDKNGKILEYKRVP